MYATNLIGMKIPKLTTFFTANHGPEQASAESVVARMKRKQAEASSSPSKRAAAAPLEVSDVDMVPASEEHATQPQPSEVALSPAEAAEDALQKAFAKLLMKPNPGTEAMVAYLAKGMSESYIKNDNLTLHSVEFQIMTDEHKMQIALMIESLASK